MEQLHENPLQIALVENEELREQLAKANERVAELEKESDLAITRLMAAALALSSGKECPVAIEELNKFAIENQVKGAEALIYAFPLNASNQMKEWVEQLRKEQE
jgi:hypothetical protein